MNSALLAMRRLQFAYILLSVIAIQQFSSASDLGWFLFASKIMNKSKITSAQ